MRLGFGLGLGFGFGVSLGLGLCFGFGVSLGLLRVHSHGKAAFNQLAGFGLGLDREALTWSHFAVFFAHTGHDGDLCNEFHGWAS